MVLLGETEMVEWYCQGKPKYSEEKGKYFSPLCHLIQHHESHVECLGFEPALLR